MELPSLLQHELQGSVDFFLDFTNLDPDSRGFGLTVDATKEPGIASIAATGFALSAWVIASERGFLLPERALLLAGLLEIFQRMDVMHFHIVRAPAKLTLLGQEPLKQFVARRSLVKVRQIDDCRIPIAGQ